MALTSVHAGYLLLPIDFRAQNRLLEVLVAFDGRGHWVARVGAMRAASGELGFPLVNAFPTGQVSTVCAKPQAQYASISTTSEAIRSNAKRCIAFR